MSFRPLILLPVAFAPVSCQVAPYAPPPRPALVESVAVETRTFHGRPEAHAVVRGRLSTGAAQLVDTRQSREDGMLVLEVLEQTPRGAALPLDEDGQPTFETRIPLDLLGLEPGPQALQVNGMLVAFEIPSLQAQRFEGVGTVEAPPAVRLLDEFIPAGEAAAPGPEMHGFSAVPPAGGGAP